MALYVIATPIGNLKDITLRAIETFHKVDLLVCEDTRKTGILLKMYADYGNTNDKRPKFMALNSFNEDIQTPKILNILGQGKDVGLISNAGTPLISDPGYKLVKQAIEQGTEIIPIPGPSSITTILSASGLPCDKFTFLGFVPKKENDIIKLLDKCYKNPLQTTYVAFISPYRIISTLKIFNNYSEDILICLANDLTKLHEHIETKGVGNWIKFFELNKPRGEYTAVFMMNTK